MSGMVDVEELPPEGAFVLQAKGHMKSLHKPMAPAAVKKDFSTSLFPKSEEGKVSLYVWKEPGPDMPHPIPWPTSADKPPDFSNESNAAVYQEFADYLTGRPELVHKVACFALYEIDATARDPYVGLHVEGTKDRKVVVIQRKDSGVQVLMLALVSIPDRDGVIYREKVFYIMKILTQNLDIVGLEELVDEPWDMQVSVVSINKHYMTNEQRLDEYAKHLDGYVTSGRALSDDW